MSNQISSLIENQLPAFIVTDYGELAAVLESYYKQLEATGQPLDIISNIAKYRDIDFYEKNLLKESTTLTSNVSAAATTITVADASSFPKKDGYIKIGDEICFYAERTDTEFLGVARGVHGTTQLGDLHETSVFESSNASSHFTNTTVYNLSHLFLYAFVKAFEREYLVDVPEVYLKGDIDKRQLIKNISDFYKVKGTDKSIRFIFNSIVSKSADDVPTTYYPKDFTVKVSESNWDSAFALQVIVLSGNPDWLIGESIVQQADKNSPDSSYASVSIENVVGIGKVGNYGLYNLLINPTTVNGNFEIPQKTVLDRDLTPTQGAGDTITVDSTLGWTAQTGYLQINNEIIRFEGKGARQFIIRERGNITRTHSVGDLVVNYSNVTASTADGNVKLLVYGTLTNLNVENAQPYSQVGDKIQISKPGFETKNPVIYDQSANGVRWKVNTSGLTPSVPFNPGVGQGLQKFLADVSAVYEDSQYYYFATSSYPSTPILTSQDQPVPMVDPQLLKLIPKETSTTPEVYKTPTRDVGIFVDGSIAFSFRSENNIAYGDIQTYTLTKRGSGYTKPPYVLVNGDSSIALSTLAGDTVNSIVTIKEQNYTADPLIEITAGRNGKAEAIITSGEITSIRVIDAGEYYSAPPLVIISDLAGKGRFAEYRAKTNTLGKITEFEKISGGKFYTQENVRVELVSEGQNNPASATAEIYRWVQNRFFENELILDDNNGLAVKDAIENEYYYGVAANPKRLRLRLQDNIQNITFQETATLNHSPILGYAYDGNPIYGPYGFSDPLDSSSSVARMNSGYQLKSSRTDGPVDAPYDMGTFVDDYEWVATVDTGKTRLDINNGRFCVTPEFPQGTYAYFITIDATNKPVYPYILGENFYSLPVRSNYESKITQKSIPSDSRRLFIPGTLKNGSGELAFVDSVTTGFVSSVKIEDSQPNFQVGSRIYVDDAGTGGSGASGIVSSTFGKPVTGIESKELKAVQLTTLTSFFGFLGDTITQEGTGAVGELIRDVSEENTIVLRAVSGTFEPGNEINSSTRVINLLLSQNSTYTQGETLALVLFDDPTTEIATGEILAGTVEQNAVRLKVLSGNFDDYLNYAEGEVILKSSDLGNTAGTEIVIIKELSKNVGVTGVDESIAILETTEAHDFGSGDIIDITVDPDEATTETTYYVTKKKFQEVSLLDLQYSAKVNDSGIGASTVIGLGKDYYTDTYNDVPLVFANAAKNRDDVVQAKATVVVAGDNFDGSGNIASITITDPGSNYRRDDILTLAPNAVPRVDPADLDQSPNLGMEYTNQQQVEANLAKRFFVAEADYDDFIANEYTAAAFGVNDAGNVNFIYQNTDPDNFSIQYFIVDEEGDELTTSDTIGGYAITATDTFYPQGSLLPQYVFKDLDTNEENPDYSLRVGSTLTIPNMAGHTIYVVSNYSTSTASDGYALKVDDYDIATGSSTDQSAPITFTPQFAGTYYYICIAHPEMVGTITVYAAPGSSTPLINVDSAGFGVDRTDLNVTNTFGIATNDLLSIGSEVIKVVTVDNTNKKMTVLRAQEGTSKSDHGDGKDITSFNPTYNFTPGSKLGGNTANDPVVVSYDKTSKTLVVNWDYDATSTVPLTNVSSIEDQSTPPKVVSISSTEPIKEKLLFSLDNTNFDTNPVVDIQKYYFYKFDVSHPSMLNSYLDISTSPNFNVFTEEKEVGLTEPGNPGAFVRIRLGYGANIGEKTRKDVNFTSYYYFLTNSSTDTEGSFLRVIDDPLSGRKSVTYTTDTKVVYGLDEVPQYDGSGDINYTGRSVGKISSITLDNLGSNYKKLPIIKGVVPADGYKAEVTAVRNATTNEIEAITISDPGQGYSKPELVVASGEGTGLRTVVDTENGKVTQVRILNGGTFTETPLVDIIETDNKLFFESENIGVPQNVNFVKYGSGFHTDDTIISEYFTPSVFVLRSFDLDAFKPGELIEQRSGQLVTAQGRVAPNGWTKGSNILRLEKITGVFKENEQIIGKSGKNTAVIDSIKKTTFAPVIVTRDKTLGVFTSDRGKISSGNQKIHDSDFYQDYSYVIRSRTPIKQWRNIIKDTTHPAGFKAFGEVYLETQAPAIMPTSQPVKKTTVIITGPPVNLSTVSTRRSITTSVFKVEDSRVSRGVGSVSVDDFDETLFKTRELELTPAFDGRYDPQTGLKIGNTQFTIIDKATGTAYTPYNEQELLMTIDGVAQRPGYSFKVTGNQLNFYEPPLGIRIVEDQEVPAQQEYIRSFRFREDTDNARYLKRLQNIADSFDGRTRIFDLRWEDGSVVKTSDKEDLFVYLDGVLQQGSYEIRRFSSPNKTDRIAFDKAPKNYKDLYDADAFPQELQNETYFYGFGVGLYERLGIDERIVPFNTYNSYSIYDSKGDVINVDDDKNLYVYVDGVLQNREFSYKIAGSSIIFNQPLTYAEQADGGYTTARVDIIRLYGKDAQQTVTLFNHEPDVYYNRATVELDLAGGYGALTTWRTQNTTDTTIVRQGDKVWGDLISVSLGAGNTFKIELRSQNILSDESLPIIFDRNDGSPLTLNPDSFTITYVTNEDGERILNRVEANYIPYLPTGDAFDSFDYRGEILKQHPNLRVGDKIKIDGETDFRRIISSPLFARPTEYRDDEQVSNNFFTKIAAGNYDGERFGEGLSVVANIDAGKVTSLDWNRRDLSYYFNHGILINPTAYNYNSAPILNFIPVNGEGGGAKARVIVYGGQIIDIEIVDPGSGYTKAPRVVVSRGYSILRENNHPEFFMTRYTTGGGGQELVATISAVSSVVPLYNRNLIESIAIIQQPNPVQFNNEYVRVIQPASPAIGMGEVSEQKILSQIQYVAATESPAAVSQPAFTRIFPDNMDLGFESFRAVKTRYFSSGVIAIDENPVNNPQFYSQGKLGTTVSSFIDYLFLDVGYANVSGITLEQLELTYTQFAGISEGVDTWMDNMAINASSLTTDGTLFNPGVPSLQEHVSFLDAPATDVSIVLYVPDTSRFPDSGKLLLGKELVTYTSKSADRFAGVTRGVDGTTAEAHAAGTFIRTIGLETTL